MKRDARWSREEEMKRELQPGEKEAAGASCQNGDAWGSQSRKGGLYKHCI